MYIYYIKWCSLVERLNIVFKFMDFIMTSRLTQYNLFKALFILIVVMVCADSYGQVYECKRASSPIFIDGEFNEPGWKNANWIPFRESTADKKVISPGKFAVLWDSEYLYFAFDFEDKNILSTIRTRDDRVYVQDVAETFINPSGDERVYYEFQFNAIGTIRDILVVNYQDSDRRNIFMADYTSGTRLKAKVDGTLENNLDLDKNWKLEAGIPFSDLWLARNIPPQIGDQWKINIYRIDHGLEKKELQAWNPTMAPSFHVPKKFGTMIFKY